LYALRPLRGLGVPFARSPKGSHAHFTHIFAVAGTLRVPLSQPQKRRIQPKRYVPFGLNIFGEII